MQEATHRRWDIWLRCLAMVGAVAAAAFAYYTFFKEYEERTRQPFIELTTKYYLEVVEAAGRVTYPKDAQDKADAIVRFNQLYVGASALVEQPRVEEAVSAMYACTSRPEACDQLALESRSLVLSGAVRESLVELWRLPEDGGEHSAADKPVAGKPR